MNELGLLFERLLNRIDVFGWLAPLVYIPLYVFGTMFFVATAFLAFTAGALFGIGIGMIVVCTSYLISATVGFFAGRYFSRAWILKKISCNKKFHAIDNAVAEKSWKLVLLLRLSATPPFMATNYCLGLSKINFKRYILSSALGMLPGALMYVILGALVSDFVVGADQWRLNPAPWAFILSGVLATVGTSFYLASLLRKATRNV